MWIDYIAHPGFIAYLNSTWLKYTWKVIRCYTDHIQHLGNTTTSCDEDDHSGLKLCLQGSQGDLDHVIDMIEMKIMNQVQNFHEKVAIQQNWRCFSHQHAIFWEIIAHITSYALNKIMEQKKLLMRPPEQQNTCTESFTTSMNLPCSHCLQELTDCIRLNDIDPHWQFEAPQYHHLMDFTNIDELPLNPLLQVANPPVT